MRKFKRGIVSGVAVLTFAGLMAACSSDPVDEDTVEEGPDTEETEDDPDDEADDDDNGDDTAETGEAQQGGNLQIAVFRDAVSLDPHGSNDTASTHIRTNIYEKLVNHDENMEIQPELAEDFEQLDEYTWEFTLREDVTFTDGTPFNAESVQATLERVLDEETASPKNFMYEMIDEIEIVDDYTVQIITEFPFAPLAANLAHDGGGMISAQAIEEEANGERNLDLEPVGTGPFMLENWDQGNEVVLTRNEDYWGEPTYLDTATYSVVPEQSTRIGQLETGEAHVIDDIEPINMSQIESLENADVSTVESLRLDYIGMNNEVEPFDDPDVRRAIAMAVDKSTIVQGIYEGYGSEAIGPLNPLVFGYSEGLTPLEYDPEEAQELLDAAGYEDGFDASLLVDESNPLSIQMAEIVQDQLSEFNINISLDQQEWSSLLDNSANGQHDMVVLGWTTVTGDADYGMYSLYHTDEHGASGNRTFYSNSEVDDLLDEARYEEDDDRRVELYAEAQQMIIDDAPKIFTVHDEFRVGISNDVEGFIQLPNGVYDISGAYLTDGDDASY
ncbi:oligopeptide ABC transporter, periplasmic oligopeptide-binding protein OppA [Geomicrobium sp. JCM 19037]|uniref:glutathione ABC transporter substrate-binding protein n=1 Tax=Geomicrobium sp. JCM 19037 TaxID=1460634 RepID=UPI00045F3884|nr:glutathione ABC transporter substrate-binding protein [Geomicrobium sp. JCM 19037]GAK02794.1 oligopeptide ABC transporter, periplasmic oligopeptide-binding protein OppA [Geomicrobium sp. JCM 19037]